MHIFESQFNNPMLRFTFILFFTFCWTILTAQSAKQEKGIASYYADKFVGRQTASGEIYDNNSFTAAHRKLPFGTLLKVTNLENGKIVIVKVNDRGPYAYGRIIDLSKAAAQEIDMIKNGLAEVMIEIVNEHISSNGMESNNSELSVENTVITSEVFSIWETPRNVSGFGIQLASFESKEHAISFAQEAYKNGVELPLIKVYEEKNKQFFRVMAGSFSEKDQAEQYLKKLKQLGYKGFVKTYQ